MNIFFEISVNVFANLVLFDSQLLLFVRDKLQIVP